MKRLKVGLIGLGEVAQVMHLRVLHRLSDRFEIAAAHDISPSVLRRVGERWQIPGRCPSVESLLSDQAIDAVIILSPDQFHFEHASSALAAGKHVFIEKPACLTPQHVRALADRVEAAGRVAMVGYMRRYAPAFLAAKEQLGAIGPLTHVNVRDFMCEGPWFHRQTSDVVYPAGDVPSEDIAAGRALRQAMMRSVCGEDASPSQLLAYEYLTGVSSHSISAIRDLFGMPRRVAAAHVSAGGKHLVAVLDYGDFSVTYEYLVDDIARFDAAFEIYAPTAKMTFAFETPYVRNLPMQFEVQQSTPDGNSISRIGPFYKDAFVAEMEAFYDCIAGTGVNRTPVADSIADFDIFSAIVAMLRTSG